LKHEEPWGGAIKVPTKMKVPEENNGALFTPWNIPWAWLFCQYY